MVCSISKMTSLKRLDFSDNDLSGDERLSYKLSDLTNLEILGLSDCSLIEIPDRYVVWYDCWFITHCVFKERCHWIINNFYLSITVLRSTHQYVGPNSSMVCEIWYPDRHHDALYDDVISTLPFKFSLANQKSRSGYSANQSAPPI